MTTGTILEVLDKVMNEARECGVVFYGTTAVEYIEDRLDYTGKGEREIYRIERKAE
jgi:hypothetical protein